MLERVIAGIKADPGGKKSPKSIKATQKSAIGICAVPDGKMVANPNAARLGIIKRTDWRVFLELW